MRPISTTSSLKEVVQCDFAHSPPENVQRCTLPADFMVLSMWLPGTGGNQPLHVTTISNHVCSQHPISAKVAQKIFWLVLSYKETTKTIGKRNRLHSSKPSPKMSLAACILLPLGRSPRGCRCRRRRLRRRRWRGSAPAYNVIMYYNYIVMTIYTSTTGILVYLITLY